MALSAQYDKSLFQKCLRDLKCSLKSEDTDTEQLKRIEKMKEISVKMLSYYNGSEAMRNQLLMEIKENTSLKLRLSLFSVLGYVLKNDVCNRFFDALNHDKILINLEQWYKVLTSKFSSLVVQDEEFLKSIAPNFFEAFKILGVTSQNLEEYMHLHAEYSSSSVTVQKITRKRKQILTPRPDYPIVIDTSVKLFSSLDIINNLEGL